MPGHVSLGLLSDLKILKWQTSRWGMKGARFRSDVFSDCPPSTAALIRFA